MPEEVVKLPPQALDAEKSVLGASLMDERAIDCIKDAGMTENWFFYEENKTVFSAIMDLNSKGVPVDPLTVSHALETQGRLESVGSFYIDGLVNACVTAAHSDYYITVIRDKFMKREIILPAVQTAQADIDTEASAMDIITKLSTDIDNMKGFDPLEIPPEVIKASIAQRRKDSLQSGFMGISSKWLPMQNLLGGYRFGKVCLLGARTSIGKTTIALNEMRFQIAKEENPIPTAFFSLETDLDEIYEQLAAEHIGLNLHAYSQGKVTDKDILAKFDRGIDWYMSQVPFYPTQDSMDIDKLCFSIQYMARKKGVKFVVVDFIQIIKDNHVMAQMRDERSKRSYVSKRLFDVFRSTGVAGIVLTQLNRDADIPHHLPLKERWKHVPQCKHLKETGSLEEDAYQVILACHDPVEDNPRETMKVDLLMNVAKNKRGPTGIKYLTHLKQEQKIVTSNRTPS